MTWGEEAAQAARRASAKVGSTRILVLMEWRYSRTKQCHWEFGRTWYLTVTWADLVSPWVQEDWPRSWNSSVSLWVLATKPYRSLRSGFCDYHYVLGLNFRVLRTMASGSRFSIMLGRQNHFVACTIWERRKGQEIAEFLCYSGSFIFCCLSFLNCKRWEMIPT